LTKKAAGDDDDAHAAPLHRLNKRAKITVAGKQHHSVDVGRDLHGIDCELNVHVALNLAPPAMIDELLRRLCNDV
jgi:hypothetical protein